MTRKDYILIAKHLNKTIALMNGYQVTSQFSLGFKGAVDSVVSALKSDNPNFDVQKFIDAVVKE